MRYTVSRVGIVFSAAVILSVTLVNGGARALLEKPIPFTSNDKTGSCKYWTVYIGNFPCMMKRAFPGHDEETLKVDMNVTIVSSGYAEAVGVCNRGKVDAKGKMYLLNDSGRAEVRVDDIDKIYEDGKRVTSKQGKTGDLMVDVEGNELTPKVLTLRKYNVIIDMGDTTLKLDNDIPINSFSVGKSPTTGKKGRAK